MTKNLNDKMTELNSMRKQKIEKRTNELISELKTQEKKPNKQDKKDFE